jgi:hypothetical protein
VHATKDRPVVENGQIVIRPINYLAQSYDHRIIDGREAVLSLVAIKEALEDPRGCCSICEASHRTDRRRASRCLVSPRRRGLVVSLGDAHFELPLPLRARSA